MEIDVKLTEDQMLDMAELIFQRIAQCLMQ